MATKNKAIRTITLIKQLVQLQEVTYENDLYSKEKAQTLVSKGLAINCDGYYIISFRGIEWMIELEILDSHL